MTFSAEVLGRIAAAAALGAMIGFEREAADQPAGLRTHITVAIGACVFGIVSTLGFTEFDRPRAETNLQADVTRVASQVVVGIGFLGAGVIFRQGTVVKNLTTAASLWVTAAIGLAAGVGDIGTALIAAVALTVCLAPLKRVRRWLRNAFGHEDREVRVTLRGDAAPDSFIAALRDLPEVTIDSLSVQKDHGAAVIEVTLHARVRGDLQGRLGDLSRRSDVDTLLIE